MLFLLHRWCSRKSELKQFVFCSSLQFFQDTVCYPFCPWNIPIFAFSVLRFNPMKVSFTVLMLSLHSPWTLTGLFSKQLLWALVAFYYGLFITYTVYICSNKLFGFLQHWARRHKLSFLTIVRAVSGRLWCENVFFFQEFSVLKEDLFTKVCTQNWLAA